MKNIKIFYLFIFFIIPSMASSMTLEERLFSAIKKCDLVEMESALKAGANTESIADESWNLRLEYTALGFAIFQVCDVEQFQTVEEKIHFTKTKVTSMIALLMRYGAKADYIVNDPHHWMSKTATSFPLLHLPFLLRLRAIFAVDYFMEMVRNGASVGLQDSMGENILKYTYEAYTEKEIDLILSTGISFMQKKTDGHPQVSFFPSPYLSESYLKAWIQIMSPTWNMPSGENRQPVITALMRYGCPVTKMKDISYSSFGKDDIYDQEQNNTLHKVYRLIIELIKNQDIDFSLKDREGKDVLTYALHYCPFEVTQEILKRSPNILRPEHIEKIVDDFLYVSNGISKWGENAFLNNDDKTFKFLQTKGLKLEGLNLRNLGVDNRIILQEQKIFNWVSLKDVGLDFEKGFNMTLESIHLTKEFTDLKETTFPLNGLIGKKVFHFSGRPIGVFVSSTTSRVLQRSLRTFPETKSVEFEVRNGILYYKFFGDFDYQGQTDLHEIDLKRETVVVFRETKSEKNKISPVSFFDNIVLKKGEQKNISKALDARFFADLSRTYIGFDSFAGCRTTICEYLDVEKKGADTFIGVNEKKLVQKDPTLKLVWDYINTPKKDRVDFIQNLGRSSISPRVGLYFLDAIKTDTRDQLQEEENFALIHFLLRIEFSGRFLLDIKPLESKINEISPLNPNAQAQLAVIKYLLTNNDLSIAVEAVTSSKYLLDYFILWKKSLCWGPLYQKRLDLLREQIKSNLPEVFQRLKVDFQQQSNIGRML